MLVAAAAGTGCDASAEIEDSVLAGIGTLVIAGMSVQRGYGANMENQGRGFGIEAGTADADSVDTGSDGFEIGHDG
jgi:hypothetical protein